MSDPKSWLYLVFALCAGVRTGTPTRWIGARRPRVFGRPGRPGEGRRRPRIGGEGKAPRSRARAEATGAMFFALRYCSLPSTTTLVSDCCCQSLIVLARSRSLLLVEFR